MLLRKVTPKETRDFVLGKEYARVTEHHNPENFKNFLKESGLYDKARIYGFVYAPDVKPIPLYDYDKNYLMSPNGSNLTNISCDYKRFKPEVESPVKSSKNDDSFLLHVSGKEEVEVLQHIVEKQKEVVEDGLYSNKVVMQPEAKEAWKRAFKSLTRWNDELLIALKGNKMPG